MDRVDIGEGLQEGIVAKVENVLERLNGQVYLSCCGRWIDSYVGEAPLAYEQDNLH